MRRQTFLPVLASCALGTCALVTVSLRAEQGEMTAAPPITKAVAVLHSTKSSGGDVSGKIIFTKASKGVRVEGEIHGLTPGEHGFHIHEFGDISAADAMSTGSHFNPTMQEHAAPTSEKRHAGDMGNIEANAKGVAKISYEDSHISFTGRTSIIGRGVIVHEKPDDFKTPKTGNAGARIASGVIGIADPTK